MDCYINFITKAESIRIQLNCILYNDMYTLSGAQAVRWSGILKVACSRLAQCSKSCDLQLSPHCSVQYVELRGCCPV